MGEVCRELGVTEMTYFRWKKQYAGLGMPELRRLKQLEDEMHSANKHHRKRRGLVARASGAFPNLDSLDTVDNFLEADSLKV